ncbi:MAG: MarC family protein [Bacteroidales bacterium]|nr:MarC family protein [Bacteroidales bacterium]
MIVNIKEILGAFVVLFAIFDIFGSIPIIIDIKQKRGEIPAMKVATISLIIATIFLFIGDYILSLFGVDIQSFAIAGAIVIFAVGIEMIFDIQVFHYENSPEGMSTMVPLVFPLICGAGSFTTLISLKAEYATINILIALVANMIVIYLVLKLLHTFERVLGKGGIYISRKFFGIILLAISVKLFASNIGQLF